MILGIDTTGAHLKMGLAVEGRISVQKWDNGPKHSRALLPQMLTFLEDRAATLEQLSALAFSQGPGSFTGLRVAVGVVQGLAYGLGLPVIAVPTMAVIALKAGRTKKVDDVLVVIHAREDEVYGGFFRNCQSGFPVLSDGPGVYTRADLEDRLDQHWALAGDGAFIFDEAKALTSLGSTDIVEADADDLMRLASVMHDRGLTVSPLAAAPLYVRETVASKSKV